MIKHSIKLLFGILALVAFLVGCNLTTNPFNPSPVPSNLTPMTDSPTPVMVRTTPGRSATPSTTPYTPMVMCTPPLCWNDESYTCGKASCPGGCGTVCATKTPDPKASPTATFPAIANPCRLPTAISSTPAPQLVGCFSVNRVKVGEIFHFIAGVLPNQLADYRFSIVDADKKRSLGFQVSRENRVQGYGDSTNFLTLVAYRVMDGKLHLWLQGKAAGQAEINVIAVGLPGAALYSEHHVITIY